MIRYAILRKAASVEIQGWTHGSIPWVFFHHNKILSKPDWGTLTIL